MVWNDELRICITPPPDEDDPPPPPPDQDCQASVGNPCDPLTGNKSYPVTDYAADGLEFKRTYQSAQARVLRSHLGRGWSHTYGSFIVSDGDELHLVTDRGRFHPFVAVNPSLYVSRLSGTLFITAGPDRWVLKRPDRHEIYDRTTGSLLEIVRPEQPQLDLTIGRDALGRVQSVTNARGRALVFHYSGDRLVSVDTPDGPIGFNFQATGHGDHELASAHYPGNRWESYQYTTLADRSLLTAVLDTGNAYKGLYTYDAEGRVTSSRPAPDVAGHSLDYLEPGRTRVTTPLGEEIDYNAHYADGWPGVATGSVLSAVPEIYEYGNQDLFRPIRATRGGRTEDYAYDGLHREVTRVETPGTPEERTTLTTWNDTHQRRASVTVGNTRTEYQYNAAGQWILETRVDLDTSSTRTWARTYCQASGPGCPFAGPLREETGPNGAITRYDYYLEDAPDGRYRQGDLMRITNPLGHVTEYAEYDPAGRPLRVIDPNGVETGFGYDAAGRLVTQTVHLETVTQAYQPDGLVSRITQADGSHLDFHYDTARRLVAIENSAGERMEYVLDAAGNRLEERVLDAGATLRQQVQRVYDQLGRVQTVIGGTGEATHYDYDANGNPVGLHAPLGRSTSQAFDALNRLRESIDPMQGITRYDHDAHDRLIAVQDPKGLTTTYGYDGLGNLLSQHSPDTGLTVFTHDAAGHVQTRTDARGKTATYTHDALGRVTQIGYPDQTLTFTYDQGPYGQGRLTGAGDAQHGLVWHHDAHGRVVEKQQTVHGQTLSVQYGYANGNLTTLITPSGQTLAYGHTHGRPTSITLNGQTTILSQVTYAPFGHVSGWAWGNGTAMGRVYDLEGRMTGLSSAGEYQLSYDAASRLDGLMDSQNAALSWTFGYDPLDRLTGAHRSGLTQSWAYDANGNRLTQGGTSSASYAMDTTSNRLLSASGSAPRTFTYDAAGNTLSDGSHIFTYNDAGRLIAATGNPATTYVINALGQRIKKTNALETRYFIYDEQGRLIGEYDGTGNLIQETVWLGDIPVATLRPNGSDSVNVYYVHTDHLNTPRRITRRMDNMVVWRWDSDPFGTTEADEDPDGDGIAFEYHLRFPGQYYDQETGLHYNYFRDYDPAIGRYVQSDPIGISGGLNSYLYALGNSLRWYDSNGLKPSCNGWWQYAGFNPQLPRILRLCTCYWLCRDCDYSVAWSGIKESLPSTTGQLYFDPTVRGPGAGDIEAGNACLCRNKPGPETGCDDEGCDQ